MSSVPPDLLAILRCPRCRGELVEQPNALDCPSCRLRYAVEGGVPDLLVEDARPIDQDAGEAQR
jgi:hypothetical protein